MDIIFKGFDSYWSTNLGNCLTTEISKNNRQNIDVFNTVVSNNQSNKSIKYIIPSATGTGKTQTTSYYIAKTLDKGFKSLVVVERTESADELQKLISELAVYQSSINSYHSKSTSTATNIVEAVDSQVLIITHSKFNSMLLESNSSNIKYELELTPYERLVKDRDLIVIDEAISTIEEISISKDSIYKVVSELKALTTTVSKKDRDLYLNEVKIIETIADDLTRHYDNPSLATDIMPYPKLLNDVKATAEVLPISLKTLNSKDSIEILNNIFYIFNSDIQYLYKRGNDILINFLAQNLLHLSSLDVFFELD